MNASDSLVSMTCECRERFPKLSGLSGATQRRLVRLTRYCAVDQIKSGERDPTIIRDACLTKIQAQKEFGSIIAIIGIAILTAVVEWIVKRILDKWLEQDA